MTRIAVIDHGAGNLVSIARGLVMTGAEVSIAGEPSQIEGVDGVVLPGVGATATAMRRLTAAGFVDPLQDSSTPLLGVCVGMQLLFDESEEDGAQCLGLIPGRVERLVAEKLPHIGWNELRLHRPDELLPTGSDGELFYFVHSYAPVPLDRSVVVAEAVYEEPFVAAVRRGRVSGVQFHPERSGAAGLAVLSNFVAECRAAADAA